LIFTGANIEYFSFARCAKTTENLQIFNHGIFFVSRPIFHKETDFAKLTKDQRREQDQDMAARYETDFAKLTKDQRREQDQDMAARYELCCYITVEHETHLSQNGFTTYKLSLHKKPKLKKITKKDYFSLLSSFEIEQL
jgi:hypothetical protein